MSTLAGTGELIRLALRRDRVVIPVWLAGLVLPLYGSVASTAALYPTEAARAQAAGVIAANPAVVALYGPATDLHTLGGLGAWKPSSFVAVLTALMSVLLVVRHTRADEEAGRLELLGSGVVGRHAPLTAALAVAFGTNVVLTGLMALSLLGQDLPAGGVLALAVGFGAVGCAFAAVAACTAQLTESARTASGMAVAVLGAVFLARAAGDAGDTWLTWLSPIGWTQRTRPFGDLHWWPLALFLVLVPAVTALAFRLAGRRDLAAGLLPSRPGPAVGGLHGPFALAWRLQRGSLLGWSVGFLVLGGALGSVASSIGDVLGDNPALRSFVDRFGGTTVLADAYLATSMGIAAILAAAYAVQSALRLRGEEQAARAEPLLATAVPRTTWALSHYVIALLGPVVLLTVAGLAGGLAHGLRVGAVGEQLPRVVAAALVQLPAVWVVAGIALAVFGVAPRWAAAGWGVLGAFLLITELGPTLDLPGWVIDLSPFGHVPRVPVVSPAATPLLALLAVAAALSAVGLAGLRRRDLA
ncbi:MAG TPA: ABC transporter permease [Pseudonocardiaceae bacterium]